MQTLIKYLKLPFCFSVEQMQQEVGAISAQWQAHYNKHDYEGSWTALPLRSVKGDMNNVIADAGDVASFSDTELMQQCPYIKSVVDTIECDKKAIRLLNLQAGAIIKEHKDAELNFESGEARIHVPIMTNDALEFYLDDERVVMNSGECWYMNFNRKHRVTNNGTTDRIHLVMDCVVNDWMRDLFTHGDWEIKNVIQAEERYSNKDKEQMLKQLISMNTPQSLQMAKQLEAELAVQ